MTCAKRKLKTQGKWMALSYAAESEGYASGSQLDSGKYTS